QQTLNPNAFDLPSVSPIQPNRMPPAAAPNKNVALYRAYHLVSTGLSATFIVFPSLPSFAVPSISLVTELLTSGVICIFTPAKNHARNAATRTHTRACDERPGALTTAGASGATLGICGDAWGLVTILSLRASGRSTGTKVGHTRSKGRSPRA